MEISPELNEAFLAAANVIAGCPERLSEDHLRAIGIKRLYGSIQQFSDFRLAQFNETDEAIERFYEAFKQKHQQAQSQLRRNETYRVESDVDRFVQSIFDAVEPPGEQLSLSPFVHKQLCSMFLRVEVEQWRQGMNVIQGTPQSEPEDSYFSQSDYLSTWPQDDPASGLQKNVPERPGLFANDPKWSDITFTIISNEAVRISVGDTSQRFNYAEMGFVDKRKGDQPKGLWRIFVDGLGRSDGQISWSSSDVTAEQQSQMKTTIKRIRAQLRAFSGLREDPFHPYAKVKAYALKSKMIDQRLGDGYKPMQMDKPQFESLDSLTYWESGTREELERMTDDLLGKEYELD